MSSKKTYEEYVRRGKALYKQHKIAKEQIVQLTLEVCDIRLGGNAKGRYTLTQYAHDIGMKRKTLTPPLTLPLSPRRGN